MLNVDRPIVNIAFALALRNAAEAHGDVKLSAIADAAICGDKDSAEDVGAIMHGATWKACSTCGGRGKVARCKCRTCDGTGADQTHPKIEVIRNAALDACA